MAFHLCTGCYGWRSKNALHSLTSIGDWLDSLTDWSRWFANEDTLDDNPSPKSHEPI
jgi:hypothetical protein